MNINPCCKCGNDVSEHVTHNSYGGAMEIRCACGHNVKIPRYTSHQVTVQIWNHENPILNMCTNCNGTNLLTFDEDLVRDYCTIRCGCGMFAQMGNELLVHDNDALVKCWNDANPLEANRFINESSPISEQAYKKLLKPAVVVPGAIPEIDPEWLKEALGRVMYKAVQKIVKDHLSKVNHIPMNIEKLRRGPRADICGVFKVQYMDGDGQLCGVEDISERRVVKFLGEEKATALKLGRVEDGHVDTPWARYTWED